MQWLIEVLGTSMDGYGVYVWPAFFICGIVMTVMALSGIHKLQRATAALSQLESPSDET